MSWLLFSPSGRIGRQPFILSFLFWVAVIAFCLSKLIDADNSSDDSSAVVWTLAFTLTALASTISVFFLAFKRLHDIGFSGIFAIAVFVPILSFVTVIALMVWPGYNGPNQYGSAMNRPD